MQTFLRFILLITLSRPCFSADTLSPTQPLSESQTLVSASGTFTLGFFSPTEISKNRYVVPQSSTGVLTLSTNGTLIITSMQHNSTTILWSSAPTRVNLNNPVAQLLDDGNFVVRDKDQANHVAWQSFDHPTDTLLPGMKLGCDLTTGLNRNLTSWKSPNNPSPGDYSITMDIRGDPQLVFLYGSVRKWRSGPWTGLSFGSIPEMVSYSRIGFNFEFVNNNREVYYRYNMSNRSIITRLVVNQTGKAERYVWLSQSRWSLFWYTPKSQCSSLDSCGPNGICYPFGSPMCSCLQGFEPRSPRDWAMMDMSSGCIRKQPLDCQNSTDGFLKIVRARLPDTWNSFVDHSFGLEECRAKCLMNCSCIGYASADMRAGGSGCILWFKDFIGLAIYSTSGQDLYVRVSKTDLGSSGRKSHRKGIVAIITVIPATLLLACAAASSVWIKRKRITGQVQHHNHQSKIRDEELELPLFDLSLVLEATNNFAPENKLGQGGFGPVYKGKLEDGLEIAVKRLSRNSLQGIDEFKNEALLITKLQHRNLVRLLGCCMDMDERMLIYEYMANKSLDSLLFGREKTINIDWQTRYQIILGVARGLLYLHQESRVTIIHRDLKAGNVLLDETMNPKISDFGMARTFCGDDTTTKTRKVVGTYGYMAPEYAMDGIFSVKSDVFSFGVLVLEIVSGQKINGEAIDPLLSNSSYSLDQVIRCIQMGLLCVQSNPKDRPTMSSVVFMLSTENGRLPKPKQPGFAAKRNSYASPYSSNACDTITVLAYDTKLTLCQETRRKIIIL
ncbi:Non-specific serine/threonine protein kinase protein [Dioscorea alata]|uniref:Non-specific serine/threonine protein kinase protein n=1 Tax=Dioscorea alata TaxID=55571 RepID=A0ACB7UNJ7_DIOAL|nr:Non-specific serine/threonine protein kinase protein [Dioscorea alata]